MFIIYTCIIALIPPYATLGLASSVRFMHKHWFGPPIRMRFDLCTWSGFVLRETFSILGTWAGLAPRKRGGPKTAASA